MVCLVALVVIRHWKPEWAPLLRLTSTVVFIGIILSIAVELLSAVSELCEDTLPQAQWSILIKALGIAFLTEFTSGICRDSGESTLATWVEAAGKLEILLLSLPLIQSVISLAQELIS
jgi:stage III sporulation protein AD